MTIDEVQIQIIQEMADLDDWLDKYDYIIEFGKKHPPIKAQYKTEQNAIPGCQSKVWMHAALNGNTLRFYADSDSIIIKGMLALLLRILDNRSPVDIIATELFFIDKTGLSAHLSPSRANGLQLIIKQFMLYSKAYFKKK